MGWVEVFAAIGMVTVFLLACLLVGWVVSRIPSRVLSEDQIPRGRDGRITPDYPEEHLLEWHEAGNECDLFGDECALLLRVADA